MTIQYQPKTEQVYKIPLMVIPPQINKFYALDLAPDKSMVRFLTKMGYQVFAISWRNPTRQHSHWGLENYVEALIEASDAIKKITRSPRINEENHPQPPHQCNGHPQPPHQCKAPASM